MIPKNIGRVYKRFDAWGWLMCILGLTLMCYYSGIFTKTQTSWWMLLTVFFVFWDYAIRVSYGRLYKVVYYDSIIHPMFEIKVEDKTFFVNAETEDELGIYMEDNYPSIEYQIVQKTFTESYVKTEQHC